MSIIAALLSCSITDGCSTAMMSSRVTRRNRSSSHAANTAISGGERPTQRDAPLVRSAT
jgi:hypothetical protein